MRRRLALLVLVVGLGAGLLGCIAGRHGCGDLGAFRISNTSQNTVQAVQIDGIDYGLLYPGQTFEIDVFQGVHRVNLIGVSGGPGCASDEVVYECEVTTLECFY